MAEAPLVQSKSSKPARWAPTHRSPRARRRRSREAESRAARRAEAPASKTWTTEIEPVARRAQPRCRDQPTSSSPMQCPPPRRCRCQRTWSRTRTSICRSAAGEERIRTRSFPRQDRRRGIRLVGQRLRPGEQVEDRPEGPGFRGGHAQGHRPVAARARDGKKEGSDGRAGQDRCGSGLVRRLPPPARAPASSVNRQRLRRIAHAAAGSGSRLQLNCQKRIAAGPRITTNSTGRKNRIIGTVSFGGSDAAFFSASD